MSGAETDGDDDVGGDYLIPDHIDISELSELIEERLDAERERMQEELQAEVARLHAFVHLAIANERAVWQAQTNKLHDAVETLSATLVALSRHFQTSPLPIAAASIPHLHSSGSLVAAVGAPTGAAGAAMVSSQSSSSVLASTSASISMPRHSSGGLMNAAVTSTASLLDDDLPPVHFDHPAMDAALELLEHDAATHKETRRSVIGVDDDTGNSVIEAISLNRLLDYVGHMPAGVSVELREFLSIVFALHPHFADAATLLALLIARWNASARSQAPVHEGLARKVTKFLLESQRREYVDAIRFWCAYAPESIVRSDAACKLLAAFAAFLADNHLANGDNALAVPTLAPTLALSSGGGAAGPVSYASVTELNAEDVARQLALLEHTHFKAVRRFELVKQAWTKADRDARSPNVCAMTRWFNHVAGWVLTEILQLPTAVARAKVIEQFVRIADLSVRHRNYSAAMEIASSLHSSGIARLKQTWALVGQKYLKLFTRLSKLISPEKNWSELRRAMAALRTPCVPYIGVFLTDLTFLDESAPDVNESSLINFDKLARIHDRLNDIVAMQAGTYDFVPQTMILTYMEQAKVWDEHEVYRVSKLREGPRAVPDAASAAGGSSGNLGSGGGSGGGGGGGSGGGGSVSGGGGGSGIAGAPAVHVQFNRKISLSAPNLRQTMRIGSRTEVTDREWLVIGAGCTQESFTSGHVIVAPDTRNRSLFRVRSGSVLVRERCIDGSFAERIVGAGALFGEPAVVLHSRDMFTTAQAQSDCQLDVVAGSFLQQLFEHRPVLGALFYRIVANSIAARLIGRAANARHFSEDDTEEVEWLDDIDYAVDPAGEQVASAAASSTAGGPLRRLSSGSSPGSAGSTSPIIGSPARPSLATIAEDAPGPLTRSDTPGAHREASDAALRKGRSIKLSDPTSGGGSGPSITGGTSGGSFIGGTTGGGGGDDNDDLVVAEFAATFQYHAKLALHGTLSIYSTRIVFEPSFFSAKNRRVVEWDEVTRIVRGKLGWIRFETERRTLEFGGFVDVDVAFGILVGLHQRHSRAPSIVPPENALWRSGASVRVNNDRKCEEDIVSAAEWELLTQGAKTRVLAKAGDMLRLPEEALPGGATEDVGVRLYQLARGSATFRVRRAGTTETLSQFDVSAPECCGVVSFLLGPGVVESELVANTDDVALNVIEPYFLTICFGLREGLECRFYRYLAALMMRRQRFVPSADVQRAQAELAANKVREAQRTILALQQERAAQLPLLGGRKKLELSSAAPGTIIAQVLVPEHDLYKYIHFDGEALPNDILAKVRQRVPAIADALALTLFERCNDKDVAMEMNKPLCTLRGAANGKMPILVVRRAKVGPANTSKSSTAATTTTTGAGSPQASASSSAATAVAAAAAAASTTLSDTGSSGGGVNVLTRSGRWVSKNGAGVPQPSIEDQLADLDGMINKRSSLELKMKVIEIEWKDKAKNRGVLDQLTSVGLAVAELTDRIATLQREIVTRKSSEAGAAAAAAAASAAAAPSSGSTSPERRHRRKKKHSHLSVTATALSAPTSVAPSRPSSKSRAAETLSDSD